MPPIENGGDSPDLKDVVARMAQQNEAMQNVIATLGQNMQALTGTMTSMQEAFSKGLNVNPPQREEEPIDLSTADTATVAQHMLKEFTKMTNSLKEDFTKQLSEVKLDKARSDRTNEFNTVAQKKGNEDIHEWLPEMRDLATKNPNLSMQQLLDLARLENNTKNEKLKTDRAEKDKAENPPNSDDAFGGLTPTSGRSFNAPNGGERKKVPLQESLNQAWEKVVPGQFKNEAASHDPLF